ncbi:MAG: Asp23/Gls24 family envelope stress response protein [Gaiellaceae bacterium]
MTYSIDSQRGTIVVSSAALAQIVIGAAESVDGARVRRPKRGLEIEARNGTAHVELELAARYGTVLPELGRAVQERVADALSRMCGLLADPVDVTVQELDR